MNSRKLAGFTAVIDGILEDGRAVHSKQRHTGTRIFERLRDEPGFSGGVIGGKRVQFHYFCMDLSHSDAPFVKAHAAEVTEAFCDGHVAGFCFFRRISRSIFYDNTRLAVARILGDGKRERSRMFSGLQSHYLFEDKFGHPGKGNDKGNVEGLVDYVRRRLMTPVRVADSLDALNARLPEQCLERRQAVLRGHAQNIGERLQADVAAFMKLPAVAFDPCHMVAGRASSLSLVRYRTNDYSVPTVHAHSGSGDQGPCRAGRDHLPWRADCGASPQLLVRFRHLSPGLHRANAQMSNSKDPLSY